MAYNLQKGLGGAATGALGGALTGAQLGSFVPVIGNTIGAGLGALAGGAAGLFSGIQPKQKSIGRVPGQPEGDFLTGYSGYGQQFPRYSPQGEAAVHELLRRGLAGSDFGAIKKQAESDFAQQTVPTLAERFTSLGSNRSSSSPAFSSQLGAASANLKQGLAALEAQYGLQQTRLGLSPLFENIYTPGQQGAAAPFLQQAAASFPDFIKAWRAGQSQSGQQQSGDMIDNLRKMFPELADDQLQQIASIIEKNSFEATPDSSQDILEPLKDKAKPSAPTSYNFLQALQRPNFQLTA